MKKQLLIIFLFFLARTFFAQSLTDSLKAYYPFNGNANDASGYGHHGTVMGATLTTDRFGNANSAYNFDGNDEIQIIPTSHLMPTNFPVTIAAWVKFTGNNTAMNVFCTDNDNGNDYGYWMNFGLYTNGTMNSAINFGDGGLCTASSRRTKVGTNPVNDGLWHLLVSVVRGPMDMDVYVDCQNDGGTYSGSGGSLTYAPSNHLTKIGYFHCTGTYHFFIGAIDEVRFYNRALSAAEVVTLYNFPTAMSGNMAAGILGNDTTLCNGAIQLNASTSWATSYNWSNGATTSTINVNSPGTYWVNISGTCGESGADTLVITGIVAQDLFPDTVVCKDQTIILDAGAGFSNYQWSTGATSQTISTSTNGNYIVQVTTATGCTISDTIQVTQLPFNTPAAQFTFTYQPAGMIQLNNTSQNAAQYQWTYSNGGLDSTFSPQHYFPCNTPITVTLISSGRCGADTASQTITYNCDGIEDITQSIDLQVFPQPAQSALTVAYQLSQTAQVSLIVHNALGQKIYETPSKSQVGKIQQQISVEKWAEGYYFLQIVSEKGIATKKIWVMK